MKTVYPIGTTIYDPEKCYNGYTLFNYMRQARVRLIDMNGNVVHEWKIRTPRAKLLKNGNLLVIERGRVREYSWGGSIVWEYEPPSRHPHHDLQRLDNGNTLILCIEGLPEEYRERVRDPVRRTAKPFRSGFVLEVTRDKEIVWEWHAYEHLDLNHYCKICTPGDWTHINTVQALPENRHYDAGDEKFKPGNILLSPRTLGFIFIVDKDTKEIVWRYYGNYAGGLAGQHEPHMIEKGLPSEGNMIIFDNGAPPMKSVAHTGKSYVLEVDPATERLVWKYENGEKFYSAFRSNVQRLPNENTLICESEGLRIFEVTRECETVWEYAVEPHQVMIGRAYRYPYDYCSQLRDLEKPKEKKATPPPYVRTEPIGRKRRVVP